MSNSIVYQSPQNQKHFSKVVEQPFVTSQSQTLKKNPIYDESSAVVFSSFSAMQSNLSLADQNVELQKLVVQKHTEAELWRNKYEQQMGQFVQLKTNYELEIERLSSEINRVNNKINMFVELEQQRVQNDIRFVNEDTTFMQVEALKNAQANQTECYEQQIEKLRQLLTENIRNNEDLNTQLQRLRIEYENVQSKLIKENELLKMRISSFEIDRQNEITSVKNKFEFFQKTNVDNIKIQYENQCQVLSEEIEKLKGILEIKNQEIDATIFQNQQQKIAYENQVRLLREDIAELKNKIVDSEHIYSFEINDQTNTLTNLHNNDILTQKANFENQIYALSNEIEILKQLVDTKNIEIENQIQDKQQMKLFYDQEIDRLCLIIEEWNVKYELLEHEKQKQFEDASIRLEREQYNHSEEISRQNQQIQVLNGELINLKGLVDSKNREIEQILTSNQYQRNNNEEDIRNLKNNNEILGARLSETERIRHQEIEELKNCLQNQEIHYREKQKQLESVNTHLNIELKKLKDLCDIKFCENENLITQRNNFESMCNRLSIENEQLVLQLQNHENQKVQQLLSLKQKMDEASLYQFDNLRGAYTTQVQIMNEQIQQLSSNLGNKSLEFDELANRVGVVDGRPLVPEVKANLQIIQSMANGNRRSISRQQF